MTEKARELLAAEMGLPVESETELSLADLDQCFISTALRAIEASASQERARVVEWLREDADYFSPEVEREILYRATAIERGDHTGGKVIDSALGGEL